MGLTMDSLMFEIWKIVDPKNKKRLVFSFKDQSS